MGALLLVSGCGDSGSPSLSQDPPARASESSDNVVARYSGRTITADEVDDYVLGLPATKRPAPGADLDSWYQSVVRTLVVDRVLLDMAQTSGLSQHDDFQLRRETIRRQIAVRACLERLRPDVGQISKQQIHQAYLERKDEFSVPERRSTFHLYRRISQHESADNVLDEVNRIRDRILNGENFQRIASSESESESRHRKGNIGWITRGELPEVFERHIFKLQEGVPGEPVLTGDGVHLFMVDEILPARQYSEAEVSHLLHAQLSTHKFDQALEEIAARNSDPQVSIVDKSTLQELAEQQAERSPVLTATDYVLSLGDFRARLGQVLSEQNDSKEPGGIGISSERAWELLNRIFRHELVFEHCERENLLPRTEIDQAVERWQRSALISRMRDDQLINRVLADSNALEIFYRSNIGLFTPPVQWNLERLRLSFDPGVGGAELMARLEKISLDDSADLEAIKQEFGGELTSIGWKTLAQIRQLSPKLPVLISPLYSNQIAAPIRIGTSLDLYRVAARTQDDPQPLSAVRPQVARAYLRQYEHEVYQDLEADLLRNVNFELIPEGLQALRSRVASPEEITVNQLDELISNS